MQQCFALHSLIDYVIFCYALLENSNKTSDESKSWWLMTFISRLKFKSMNISNNNKIANLRQIFQQWTKLIDCN